MSFKKVVSFLGLFFASLVLMVSCGSKTDSTKIFELRFAAFVPNFSANYKCYEDWTKKVAERTNNRVKVTLYGADTLIAQNDMLTGVKAGLADIGEFDPVDFMDQYPLHNLIASPFLYLGGSSEKLNKVYQKLLKKYPELKNETKDFKVLFTNISQDGHLHMSSGTPIVTPADLKGKKVFAYGTLNDIMVKIGAVPISLPVPDWYTAAERGLIKGFWLPWAPIHDMQLYEIVKNHTVFPSGGMSSNFGQIIMNMTTWNNLPSDIQKVLDDLYTETSNKLYQISDTTGVTFINNMEAMKGQTFTRLTVEQGKLWQDAAKPIIEAYVAKLDAKGLPGTAVYKEALKLTKEYNK